MGLTSQERLSRVSESAWAHKYVVALNNRIPALIGTNSALKRANGAYVNADREIVLTPEMAESLLSVLSDKEE